MIGRYDARPHASAIAAAVRGSGDRVMDRREFISGLTIGLLAAPIAGDAQEAGKIPRVGFLGPRTRADARPFSDAFLRGLRDLGWVDGKNIAIEYRFAEGRLDRLPDLAAELVRLKVDLILAGSTPPARRPRMRRERFLSSWRLALIL